MILAIPDNPIGHEAVRRGVPELAAKDFIEGHLTIEIAILFGHLPAGPAEALRKGCVEGVVT